MSRASSIPASSLSAMLWGGRGWHVILFALSATLLLLCSPGCGIPYSAEERRWNRGKKNKKKKSTLRHNSLAQFCEPGGRDGCVPTKCQPGERGRLPVITRLCALPNRQENRLWPLEIDSGPQRHTEKQHRSKSNNILCEMKVERKEKRRRTAEREG